ncbi:hypothetical protein D7B24_003016 [Verticillium nonalfalfae]|uniref:RNA-dependent RNA polymerase n=1 Tax=Verticillium nonalfalfae TaxID=1051616 RepID=A0A3M9YJR4_9PEZI|nr:uncharacterized protein D7B24_003016 [Verticillium nonalfalfae]RNJ59260.1 hypothetical protein D7B24_003016 [Verticillium nonalfalfae]
MRQGVRLRNGKAPEDDIHQDMVFEALELACGHLSLVNPTKSLTSVEQCWFDAPGHVRFANKMLLARLPDSAIILHFAYDTTTHLIHDSKAATLTAVLREAPRIFLSESLDGNMAALDVRGGSRFRYRVPERYTRIPATRHHEKYVTSFLVYQVSCETKHIIRLVSRTRHRQLFPMAHEDQPLTREPTKSLEDLETANLSFQANTDYICGAASRPLRMVLNRQMTKILEDRGVRDEWFFSQQKRELERLHAVTAGAWNTGAFLQLQGIGSAFYLSTFINPLDKYGINYRRNDFLRCTVEAVVFQELRLLKHKARIPMPQGVTFFGIMDESGFLSEGEVSVCYDSCYNGSLPIDSTLNDGNIPVIRSPALYPGNVPSVRMRTPPVGYPLRDLRNCIVFSQHGDQDLPSQLSGGDPDSDLYNIIWDRQARPKRFLAPADYPRITPTELNRQVTRDSKAGFFVDSIKSDVLGTITTEHLF